MPIKSVKNESTIKALPQNAATMVNDAYTAAYQALKVAQNSLNDRQSRFSSNTTRCRQIWTPTPLRPFEH